MIFKIFINEMNDNDKIYKILTEELSKSEVQSMIDRKLGSAIDSRDFEKKVKEISAEVISNLFKILWQRNSFWKTSVK
jgi:hypothetical protein